MSSPLLKKTDPDTLILTVNLRLARTLTHRLAQQQQAAGALVWLTPQVVPLTTWLEQCWEQLLDQAERSPLPTLLTAWQERLLWEEIMTAAPDCDGLLRVAEAADNAQNAWQLLQDWQTTLTEKDLYDHQDASAFHRWSTHFIAHCQQHHWLEHARLPDYLLQHLSQLKLPKQIRLAGFQRQSPRHRRFFAHLAQNGCVVTEWPLATDLANRDSSLVRVALTTVEAEILAAAQWSRTLLTTDKQYRIGIVIPALQAHFSKVVETFARVFYPGKNLATLDPTTNIFNVSLGVPLTATPLVRDALLLLELGKKELSLEQYTALLHSPFWHGGSEEWSKRSLLDARLRNQGLLRITTANLQRAAQLGTQQAPPCPLLAAVLSRFMTTLQTAADQPGTSQPATPPTRKTTLRRVLPSIWVTRFSQWLTVLGWPGECGLTSGEYQTVSAWRKALVSFATLDKIVGVISLNTALTHLRRLATETTFQPESGNAPVQILGLLEAVGESYDYLWIMGLSEDVWPPPLEPNPFIPIAKQRQHGMPHSSFELEVAYNTLVFDELLQSAPQVIVSHPTQNGDQPLRPSPLLAAIPELSTTSPNSALAQLLASSPVPDYNRIILAAAQLTSSVDAHGPPLQTETPVGTGVLKTQASCPFQAFVRFRLGATAPPEPSVGLDPAQRGQMVHGALTQLWHNLGKAKIGLEDVCAAPDQWTKTAAQETVTKKEQQWPEALHPFFGELEAARLDRLLHQFLVVESQRQTPFTVIEQEVDRLLSLGKLQVRVRIDRIDQVRDGSLVVLDYKTGQNNRISNWFGERPADPQLPMYALAQDQELAALAFYQVRATGCDFRGLALQEGILPGLAPWQKSPAAEFDDWSALKAHWRTILTTLGENYVHGAAQITPLPGACTYCDYHTLCRKEEFDQNGEESVESAE